MKNEVRNHTYHVYQVYTHICYLMRTDENMNTRSNDNYSHELSHRFPAVLIVSVIAIQNTSRLYAESTL